MYDFKILDLNDKANLLFGTDSKAIFLMNCHEDSLSYSLYSLKDFYVEVVLDNVVNKIVAIEPFVRGWKLDKYLPQLTLEK